jgi:hypothetical protein
MPIKRWRRWRGPRLAEAQAANAESSSWDAAHFVLGASLSMVWCFTRLFIASPSGRQRFNVLAAVAAVTKEIFTVTNETYIHAESVWLLLTKIATRYAGELITIVLDNARYQKCERVLRHAAALKSIVTPLELGGGLSLPNYDAKIGAAKEKLDTYNTLLSGADRVSDELDGLEEELTDLNERMLTGVATQFGKDSPEYEAAGGTRKSERKKPQRTPKPPTAGA